MRTKVTVTQARNPAEPKVVVREGAPQELAEVMVTSMNGWVMDSTEDGTKVHCYHPAFLVHVDYEVTE